MRRDDPLASWICEVTGAAQAVRYERVQSLWSGYGEIVRYRLVGAGPPSVILKHVDPPRGGRGDRSRARKLRSYDVEMAFYRRWSGRCGDAARVPALLASRAGGGSWCFLLEDLDAAGFAGRRGRLSPREMDRCLAWLAGFHATFVGEPPEGLWTVGTYWHLATRPDELAATADPALRRAAAPVDARLSAARFQTLVHGDAKLANFCFGAAGVAAVDFQYVGGGCGMKDLTYFLSCSLDDRACAAPARHLDIYFAHLRAALAGRGIDAEALEREWRALYPLAWVDFNRFMAGWAPGHWRGGHAGQRLTLGILRRHGL